MPSRSSSSPQRRVTLKDLSREAGVNPSTVSRVLNDPDGVATKWASPETAQKILELAASLGYTKNPHAASLRTARSGLIGVVVPRLQDYVLATMYEGVDAAAAERDVFTVVTNSMDDPDLRRKRIQLLLDRRVEGLILGDSSLRDPLLDSLAERGVPFALMNRRSGGYLSATCDDYEGGYAMGEHFAHRGYASVAIISGSTEASTSVDRSAGFRDALSAHGYVTDSIPTYVEGFDAPSGARAAQRILQQTHLPRAIFAINDFSAIGAYGALRDAGLRIPEDIAIAGFNDTPLASGVNLTTVRSPMFDVGYRAMTLLGAVLDGRPVQAERLAAKLIERASA